MTGFIHRTTTPVQHQIVSMTISETENCIVLVKREIPDKSPHQVTRRFPGACRCLDAVTFLVHLSSMVEIFLSFSPIVDIYEWVSTVGVVGHFLTFLWKLAALARRCRAPCCPFKWCLKSFWCFGWVKWPTLPRQHCHPPCAGDINWSFLISCSSFGCLHKIHQSQNGSLRTQKIHHHPMFDKFVFWFGKNIVF